MLVGAEKAYAFLQKRTLLESQMDCFLFYMLDVR